MATVTVIVPTLNEASAIGKALSEMPDELLGEVIGVDSSSDRSTDRGLPNIDGTTSEHLHKQEGERTHTPIQNKSKGSINLCIVSAFPPNTGNLAEWGYYLVKELVNNPAIKNVLVIANQNENAPKMEKHGKLTILRVWRNNDIFSLLKIPVYIAKYRPNVVHFNLHLMSWGKGRVVNFIGALMPRIVKLLGFHVGVTLHNIAETIDIRKIGIKASLINILGLALAVRNIGSVDEVVVTLPHYVSILKKRYGVKNASYLPHGTIGAQVSEVKTGGKRLLTFGHFSRHKNLPAIIDVFKEIREEDEEVELVVAGTSHPNFPEYLPQVIRRYKGLRGLSFTGYVPEDELKDVFTSATVVVMPYLTNTGSSGVFHIASSFGKPCIMSDVPDFRKMLKDEEGSAILVPPHDRKALKDAIVAVLASEDLQKRIGDNNLRMAKRMSFNDVSHAYADFYSDLSRAHRSEYPRWRA
jgi:glycosyltransferase involved in cell wall biosynthesis